MSDVNTLYLQKERAGAVMIDTVSCFGVYTAEEMPDMDPTEPKVDGNAQDWPDEDGLDVIDTDEVFMKEFEVEIPMVCVGETPDECRAASRRLVSYMTGRKFTNASGVEMDCPGSLMKVFQPWVGYGRRGARFKGISDHDFWRSENGQSVYAFKLKIEITDPISVVEKKYDEVTRTYYLSKTE